MVVYISNNVKKSLHNYRRALKRYPISRQRAHEKYNNMVDVLLNLGNSQVGCIRCIHKKLGQMFDSSRNPIFKNLYRFNYTDESKYQWAFAFVIDKTNETITITKMLPAKFVTEAVHNIDSIITEVINSYLRENLLLS